MPRQQNAHALQNSAFLLQFDRTTNKIRLARILFGHVNKNFIHATKTEAFLKGKNIFDNKVLQAVFKLLNEELECDDVPPEPHPEFRKKLAISLFYKVMYCSAGAYAGGEVILLKDTCPPNDIIDLNIISCFMIVHTVYDQKDPKQSN